MDLLEDTNSGKNSWGLVFYGVKSKLLAYYMLGSKYPTASSTLVALGKFIADHSIPRSLITDSGSILGDGKKCKQVLERTFTPLHISKPDKHNQKPVERAIQNLKTGCEKIRNACGTGVLA